LKNKLVELAVLFLRIGFTSFGGPAAHNSLMHLEFVEKRKWLDEQKFLDFMGAANLIPGPNSTELAMHIGYQRAGWRGFIIAGCCFILPAMSLTIMLTYYYKNFGTLLIAEQILYAIKPVIIAIILKAILSLGKSVLIGVEEIIIAAAALGMYLLGVNEILILLVCGLIMTILKRLQQLNSPLMAIVFLPGFLAYPLFLFIQSGELPYLPSTLFLSFVKIGSVLYGSGYVLLAFLEGEFVKRLGWLTYAQLVDVVAIGQVTPGPLFTTATSIGYLLDGINGAILSTTGIFLPAFIFVAISFPLVPHLRKSVWSSAFLNGVNASSLALMTGVSIKLARVSFVDPFTIVLGLVAVILVFRSKVNPTWFILGGALIGALKALIG